jgi:hypothetical protein
LVWRLRYVISPYLFKSRSEFNRFRWDKIQFRSLIDQSRKLEIIVERTPKALIKSITYFFTIRQIIGCCRHTHEFFKLPARIPNTRLNTVDYGDFKGQPLAAPHTYLEIAYIVEEPAPMSRLLAVIF